MTIIYFENPKSSCGNSVVVLSPNSPVSVEDAAEQAIVNQGLPANTPWVIVEDAIEPVFKNARTVKNGKIVCDVEKSKAIAHEKRRAARAAEFAAVDGGNMNVVVSADAELQRKVIRDKYAQVQADIDAKTSIKELKTVVESL